MLRPRTPRVKYYYQIRRQRRGFGVRVMKQVGWAGAYPVRVMHCFSEAEAKSRATQTIAALKALDSGRVQYLDCTQPARREPVTRQQLIDSGLLTPAYTEAELEAEADALAS